jgi:1-aminocyclopropane-1-carboxylate deaminase/D-cysteine desulfhydrase-like pyridoxal-dependent ACC family enzyme
MIQEQLDRIPRLPLLQSTSPVRRMGRLFPNQEVWLKDDSRIHNFCGGNKVRRLEYLLAPFRKNRKEVLTFGYETSNHVLATAYFCSQMDVPTLFIL